MFASNIHYLRKKENLSQEEFAERFGVSRQSVAKWENGDSTPDVGKCVEIADYYELSMDVLLRIPLEEHDFGKETGEGKYIFGMAKVGERGQVVIPKYAREVFDIHSGDRPRYPLAFFSERTKNEYGSYQNNRLDKTI